MQWHELGLDAMGLDTAQPAHYTAPHEASLNSSKAGGGKSMLRTLLGLLEVARTSKIDYLKLDCEGCEFDALPQFLNASMHRFGHVPLGQLQVEMHVSGRLGRDKCYDNGTPCLERFKSQQRLTELYAHGGVRYRGHRAFDSGYTNPQAMRAEWKARRLLATLQRYGFVPFHIDFTTHASGCCGSEYTFLNTRAPEEMLAPLLRGRRARAKNGAGGRFHGLNDPKPRLSDRRKNDRIYAGMIGQN